MKSKLFVENIDLTPQQLVEGILESCGIKNPPTNDQLVFDFMKVKRDNIPTSIDSKYFSPFDFDPDIRAMLDVKEKLVLIHPNLKDKRYTFSSFHELGHYILPKHRELLYRCSWEDLSYYTQKKMEIEANEFAVDCIFQNERFTKQAADYQFGLKAPIELADKYGASFEATIRRYVEKNPNPCALVVYRPISDEVDAQPTLEVNYSIISPSWKHFGYIIPHQKSIAETIEHKTFYEMQMDIVEGELSTRSEGEEKLIIFPCECFSNSYKVFQLVFEPNKKSK